MSQQPIDQFLTLDLFKLMLKSTDTQDDDLFLQFVNGDHEDQRLITFTPTGPASARLLSRSAAVSLK